MAHQTLHRNERNESPSSDNHTAKETMHKTTEDYYEDDEELMSSSPLLSESSTIGGEDVVQFVLETEDDPNPSSHSTILSGSSPTSGSQCSLSSDINNNDNCLDEKEDEKCCNKIFDHHEAAVVDNDFEINKNVEKRISFDHEDASKR